MFRFCRSFATAGCGRERAALESDLRLMNVDADDREAVSGRSEDMTAREKESFADARSRYKVRL